MEKANSRFLRNKDLIDQSKLSDVIIIGAGGIGSFIIQGLTIMGYKSMYVYDPDTMSTHNLSSTAYPTNMVDRPKAEAASVLHSMYDGTDQEFIYKMRRWDQNEKPHARMIVCTDDMESRKAAFESWYNQENQKRDWFIDARMGATTTELVTESYRAKETESYLDSEYMKTWIPTDSVPKAPCSQKHTVFAAQHIASLAVAQVYNLVANLGYYDYIQSCLSPNSVQFGTLIRPDIGLIEQESV